MPLYNCDACVFVTYDRIKYLAHLNTTRHEQLANHIVSDNNENIINNENGQNLTPFDPDFGHFSPNFGQNSDFADPNQPQMTPNDPNLNPNADSILFLTHKCSLCYNEFSNKSHLTRHLNRSCKVKKEMEKLEEEDRKKEEKERKKKEDEDEKLRLERIRIEENHKAQIDMLLEKVGNTTITNNNTNNNTNNTNNINNTNNTNNNIQQNNIQQNNLQQNNIQLNNYGQEDLTMLTDKYMRKMVIYPYTAIPKMIKKIHFNDKYPANQNIRLLNKKGNKLQIRNNDKWEFVDKKETMEQLINEKNYQLDQYYEENKEAFNDTYQNRFDQFQDKMGAGERKVIKNINTGSELVFWNSM